MERGRTLTIAVTFAAPNTTVENAFNGLTDHNTDTFKITLHNNYTFDATHNDFSDVSSSELASNFGYTQQTETLTTVTSVQAAGTYVFNADNVTWTASGGTIGPATDAWVYDDTATSDKLVCAIDFGASESANDGAEFNINWNASGIFTGAFA